MQLGTTLIQFSLQRPKLVTWIMIIVTLCLGSMMVKVHVDTDPENMLAANEAVRVFHDKAKKDFTLHDVVVLGIVNETDPNGVFNPETLGHVHELTEFAKTLQDPKNPERKVIARDIMAPGNIDTIEQAGPGQVRFKWLMKEPPKTREEALEIRDLAMANPLLKGTLVSEDGKAIGIYIPVTSKDYADTVRSHLLKKIESFGKTEDHFHITGLPVAEDTFGKEMFIQMAISAPLAMLVIFLLLLFFFKKLSLIISPLIIAMVTVICTMGVLIGTGNTLHIMSSMIPIFLMPIAVVDSVHILSEFFDEYQQTGDRRKTLEHVVGQLFVPMLYTSLTSSAGFASLAFTPIPPVQAFGIFVAMGIMLAWFLTIIFIPAYIMMMSEESLANFGATKDQDSQKRPSLLNRHLHWIGRMTAKYGKLIIVGNILVFALAIFGITKITINDNPVKWFHKNHEIRIADRILNSHFGGTYEAFLILEQPDVPETMETAAAWLRKAIATAPDVNQDISEQVSEILESLIPKATSPDNLLQTLVEMIQQKLDAVAEDDDSGYESWDAMMAVAEGYDDRNQLFKQPEILNYMDKLQQYLQNGSSVGKSNSIVQVVKKVHQELFEGKEDHYTVPKTAAAVAQCLISFQNSHKPEDLFHMVTPDYVRANIWIQLRSGDNVDMQKVMDDVETFFDDNPPPARIEHKWAGLTYINVIWQEKMVAGMLQSFMGSFVIVFLMMTLLFRSPSWGLLAMIPLTATIAFIYGVIGFIGKDYDMSVAVLSSLALGLAVDFAIHFIERTRSTYKKVGSWQETITIMYEEPARAIGRNTIVIALGFTPLLAAPLVPYQTVGVFLASIMLYSGLATLWILPSAIANMQGWLFKRT